MGWQHWQQKAEKLLNCAIFKETFHIFTITVLSLLLPLSFLLLARLSCYNFLLTIPSNPTQPPYPLQFPLFLYINPALLYALVSIVSIATLVHGLIAKLTLLNDSPPGAVYRPHLYIAWILLSTLQICVGLGIKGTVAAGIDGYRFDIERSLLSRVIFFLGLHETMLHWSRTVVKTVVDDTVFGLLRDERWIQRVAIAMSFGTLWWWALRDEVESLVIVVAAKRELLKGVTVADLVGWWLYYLTVTLGMIRIVKGLMWLGMVLHLRRVRVASGDSSGVEDKV